MDNLPTPPPPATPYVRQYGPKPLAPEQRQQQILFKLSSKNKQTFYKLLELLKLRAPDSTKGDLIASLLYIQELDQWAEQHKLASWWDGESWVIQSPNAERYKGDVGATRTACLAALRALQGEG